MYIPKSFIQENDEQTRALVESHAFALLVTTDDEGWPLASHIPILSRDAGDEWVLEGHVARPNPHSEHIRDGRRALLAFQGVHTYISPTWYETPGVPTWNYAAVHVYGRLSETTGESARAIVEHLAGRYEGDGPRAWVPSYPDKMLDAIVCFRMTGLTVQSKSKMSQNRPAADRHGVIEALEAAGDTDSRAVARIMRDNESRSE